MPNARHSTHSILPYAILSLALAEPPKETEVASTQITFFSVSAPQRIMNFRSSVSDPPPPLPSLTLVRTTLANPTPVHKTSPHMAIDPVNAYHTSAILGAALDVATSPLRFSNTRLDEWASATSSGGGGGRVPMAGRGAVYGAAGRARPPGYMCFTCSFPRSVPVQVSRAWRSWILVEQPKSTFTYHRDLHCRAYDTYAHFRVAFMLSTNNLFSTKVTYFVGTSRSFVSPHPPHNTRLFS